MKLVTWNVNSLKARLPRVLEFLAQHRPDCIQETKCDRADFPHTAFRDAGYVAVEHSAGRWAGVAIAAPSHTPLDKVHCGLPGEAVPAEARYVEASVGGLRVASAYVPNGRAQDSPAFSEKLRFSRGACRAGACARRAARGPERDANRPRRVRPRRLRRLHARDRG